MDDTEIMQIERACERLGLDYAYYADHGQRSAFAALFADDGELILPTGTIKGRVAIGGGPPPSPTLVTRHAISNVRIDVEGPDSATGVTYIVLFMEQREGEDGPAQVKLLAPRHVGAYHDRYVKTPAGWRFAAREYRPAMAVLPD
jgi:hypothetical protein